MGPDDCPTQRVLEDFALGRLSPEVIESVGRHIELCPPCQAHLAEFDDVSDELADRLVAHSLASPFAGEAERKRAVAMAMAVMDNAPASSASSDSQSDYGRRAGSRLGEYELLEPIGLGGMGTVYRARHTQMNRMVAIKLLPRWCQEDKRAIERFHREIRLVAQLDHPNIVRAFDARETDGERFLVMEYVAGLDLSELVRRCGPPPLADACELVRQAAVALQYVHEHDLIHRDVKPSNLMLADPGQVKLLDLGLAFVTGHGAELTDPGQLMGTLDYMAPEQAADSHDVDMRVDVYGLGATLYRLLCGEAPLASFQHCTPAKKLAALERGRIPPIRRRRPEIPRSLAAVVRRALSRRPDRRYGTPIELARALVPFCAGCDLAALLQRATRHAPCVTQTDQSLVSTSHLAACASAGTIPATPSRLPRSVPIRRHISKTMLACVGVAIVLILAGVTIVIRRAGHETAIHVPDNSTVNIDIGAGGDVRLDLGTSDAPVGSVPPPPAAALRGWCRARCDLGGTSYYPHPTSTLTSHQLEAARWNPAPLLGRVTSIVVGDLTGDGYSEVVLRDADTVVAFDRWARELWRRDPVIDSGVRLPIRRVGLASKLELADFDDDGALEVFVLVGSQVLDAWSTKAAQRAVIYDGDGSVLQGFPIIDGCDSTPRASVDFNADGHLDFVLTVGAYRHPHALCIYDSVTYRLLCRVDLADATDVAGIADIEDDGQLDLVLLQSYPSTTDPPVGDYDSYHCYATRYDRDGHRLWKQVYTKVINGSVTDMDGDRVLDIILINGTASRTELHFLDPATGAPRRSFTEMAATYCRDWSIADMNGDGAKEFIIGDGQSLLIIDAQAQLVARSPAPDTQVLATNDLDGDERTEIVAKQQCDVVVFDAELKELDRYTTPMPIVEAIIADLDSNGVNEVFIVGEQDGRSSLTVLHFAPREPTPDEPAGTQPRHTVHRFLEALRNASVEQAMSHVLVDVRGPFRDQLAAINGAAIPVDVEYRQTVQVDDASIVVPGDPAIRFTLRYANDRWWIVGVAEDQ